MERKSNSPVELIDIYPTLMDLTKIKSPKHVVGKSLVPIFNNVNHKIRNSALTRWIATRFNNVEGYSIKTENYRFVKWGENGEYGYELYDHKFDSDEMNNLANDPNYIKTVDSLKIEINLRIKDARKKPEGLGRQLKEVPYKRYTCLLYTSPSPRD